MRFVSALRVRSDLGAWWVGLRTLQEGLWLLKLAACPPRHPEAAVSMNVLNDLGGSMECITACSCWGQWLGAHGTAIVRSVVQQPGHWSKDLENSNVIVYMYMFYSFNSDRETMPLHEQIP